VEGVAPPPRVPTSAPCHHTAIVTQPTSASLSLRTIMGFDHRRTVTHRLYQAAHAYRVRAGGQLSRIGLHSGQEKLLKSLSDENGMSMSDIAASLGVQPPTITKMISRLAAQDYVERRASSGDARQAEVFLTERGRRAIATIDKVWKRVEKTALAGIEDKDRKRLRKLLRQVERNLGGKLAGKLPEDDEIEIEDAAL
jgi:MarR family transcriptional regulator, organic hydroperoxide resistance regulator